MAWWINKSLSNGTIVDIVIIDDIFIHIMDYYRRFSNCK